MKTKEINLGALVISLLILVVFLSGCTDQNDDCNCTMYTYESWNDGTLEKVKPYSEVDVDCTADIDETTVKKLDNGHDLKVFVECE